MIQVPVGFNDISTKAIDKPKLRVDETKSKDPFSKVLDGAKVKSNNENTKVSSNNSKNLEGSKENKGNEEINKNLLKKEPTVKITKTDSDIANAEDLELNILNELAAMLGIEISELENIMSYLQIGILDLLDNGVLQQFLMEIHNLDDSAGLLLIADVSKQFDEITSLIENNKEALINSYNLLDEELVSLDTSSIENEKSFTGKEATFSDVLKGIESEETINTKGTQEEKTLEPVKAETSHVENVQSEDLEEFTNDSFSSESKASEFLDTLSQTLDNVIQNQNENNFTISKDYGLNEVIEPREIINQIVEKIKISSTPIESQISINLKPEHLGKLSMEFVSKQGTMTANFMVENEKVKVMLEQNIQQLRESLEEQGIIIHKLEVTVGEKQQDFSRSDDKKRNNNKRILDSINELMSDDIIEPNNYEEDIYNDNEINYMA